MKFGEEEISAKERFNMRPGIEVFELVKVRRLHLREHGSRN